MGLFDRFKKKQKEETKPAGIQISFGSKASTENQDGYVNSDSISDDERPFYQPDEYYTFYSFPGTPMAEKVISFEERKKISYPSPNGLYVAEILLLKYCENCEYPKPSSGYPGFWWFKYGIRDIGHALESLEQRGFLRWATNAEKLTALKTADLKEILKEHSLPVSGKKEDLIMRITDRIPVDSITQLTEIRKYALTDLGKAELEANGYVYYMHTHKLKTTEDSMFGPTFNVWDINKKFKGKDASGWREIVGVIEEERFGVSGANKEEDAPPYSFPAPDTDTIKAAYTVKRHRKIDSPSPLYQMEEIDIHPINSRIPASQIKHKGNFDAGFKYGGPYWGEGEYYRKKKEYITALYFYDQARAEGYMAPALYKSYVRVYNQLKDYENAIEIMDEAVILLNRELGLNGSFFEEYNEKRHQACERLKKQREKEDK